MRYLISIGILLLGAQSVLAQWDPDPLANVPVSLADDEKNNVFMVSDGRGGALVVWEDNRLGTGREDIYAQQVDSLGASGLEPDGRLVCAADNNQNRPDVIRGAGGLLTAWKDDREPSTADRDTALQADTVLVHHDAPGMFSPVPVGLRGAVVVTGAPDAGLSVTGLVRLGIHPNPFNPRTTIVYELSRDNRVCLRIHDLAGRLLRTLVGDEPEQAGVYRVAWDGNDDRGRAVASGIYICRLEAAGSVASHRLVLAR